MLSCSHVECRVSTADDYAPGIEHFQREANGDWHYRVVPAGGTVTLTKGATISVDAVYAGVFELEGE